MTNQNDIKQLSIGIFDSGVGGISIWDKVVKLLPNESIVYFSDNKNCPYGPKKKNEIIELSKKIVDFLISENCKIIVVACNTATASAIDFLRKKYDMPFVGMEPAVKPAAINSKTQKIGILATQGTLKGKLFNNTRNKYTKNIEVIIQEGSGLVELVENGKENSDQAKNILKDYIVPMINKGIDHLVLGCTHYPFLIPAINEITNHQISIIEPSEAVAKQLETILRAKNLLNKNKQEPIYKFYCSGNTNTLINMLLRITGKNYEADRVTV